MAQAPCASKRDFMEHANDSKLLQKEEKKKQNSKQRTQKLILIKYLGFRRKAGFCFCFFYVFLTPLGPKEL